MDILTLDGKAPLKRLIVLMHGVGANKHDLEPVGRAFLSAMPDSRVILPNAPTPFEHGGPGFQWFSLANITPQNRTKRVEEILPSVTAWIDRERVALGLNCDQLILAGFSQGAIMALAAGSRGFACGKVIAFSGRLIDGVTPPSASPPTFFLGHGEDDQVIPVEESRNADRILSAKGYTTTLRTYPSLGHGISPQEIQSAIAFMQDRSG